MWRWLALLTILPFVAAAPAQAQMNATGANEGARIASSRIIDFRASSGEQSGRSSQLIREMLVNRRVTGNAAIGIGLASFYSRRKAGTEWRIVDGTAARARKPAVTLLLKF